MKALGVMVNGRAQVTMNVTDFHLTPMPSLHDRMGRLAREHGTRIGEGELRFLGSIPS